MVDALSSAANGLLNAQRRATDVAVEILKATSEQSGFQEEADTAAARQDTETQEEITPPARQEQGRPLAQQIVDLKSAGTQFKASAAAFTRAAASQDQLLGTLFDDEG